MACKCLAVLKFLEDIGAKHAAKMHKAGASQRPWTANDWRLHIREEEDLLLPLLPDFAAQRLHDEHQVILAHLRKYGRMTPKSRIMEMVEEHSKYEDALVKVLLRSRP